MDEAASDRIKRNYVQDNTRKNKSSKGKRRTNVVEGDVSHAEDELKVLVMDVTGSGGRHTLDDIENAIAAMAGADDTISKKDLNKGLTGVGIEISKKSLDTLFSHFDRYGDGVIDYKEFVRFSSSRPSKTGMLVSQFRRALWKTDPVTAFNFMDTNGDHRISRSEFAKGVRKMGIRNILDKDIDVLMHHFALKGSDGIDLRAFIDFAADAQREADDRLGSAEEALKNIVAKAATKGVGMKQSFKAFDSNGDGKISRKEFEEAVTKLGQALDFSLTPKELGQLFDRFSGNKRAKYIKYHDFVDYFTSSAEIDEAEKENLRRWKEKTKDIKPVREHTLQARAFHSGVHHSFFRRGPTFA
eukprot:g1866.t1